MHPFGVHGKNPDISPMATLPSLIVFNLKKIEYFNIHCSVHKRK